MKADPRARHSVVAAGSVASRKGELVVDHPLVEEQHLLERYLLGELDTEQTEAFEDHFLTCPQCLDQLEADERLRAAIRTLDVDRRPARPARWPRVWLAAAAVSLLLIPALGYLGWRAGQLERRLAEARHESAGLRTELERLTLPRAGSLLLRLSPLRSGDGETAPAHRLRLGPEPEWVVLLVELGATPGERCRAQLIDVAGATVWSAEGLHADAYGSLALSLYSPKLAAGEHRLRLELGSGERFELGFQVAR